MTPEEFKKKCKGIVPVQYCPFTEKGELDIDGLRQNTQLLVDFAKGGKDLVVMTNGSTTEFYANSIEEQKVIIKNVVEVVGGKVPVVAGTSQAGTKETIEMTKYAEDVGVDCAMVVLPYYHTPSAEGMYQHYRKIAESVKIGVMVYNNPDVSGSLISPVLMKKLSEISNVVAVKDNTPIIDDYFLNSAIINPGDMVLLNGRGEIQYVASAAYGFRYKGFVTWVGNFAPARSYVVYEAVKEKNFEKAEALLENLLPLFSLLGEFMNKRETISIIPPAYRTNYMYMSVGKACMDLVGLSGGPLRLPMENLSAGERDELKRVLEETGII